MQSTSRLLLDLTKGAFANWTRTLVDFSKHYEPKHLRWQWTPRRCPKVECPDLCVSRKCPKVKWYQRRKSVPKDIVVCPPSKSKQRSTLRDILKMFMPAKKEKPPLHTCRRLLQLRISKCADPFRTPECFRVECKPCDIPEWYGQAIMKTRTLKAPYSKTKDVRCLPPSYIVPRTIMCPPKKKALVLDNPKPPFEEMLKDRARLMLTDYSEGTRLPPTSTTSTQVKIPHQNYKHKRICKPKDTFKAVPCPHHLYQRYRSVKLLRKTKVTPTPVGYSRGGFARWRIASLQPGIVRGSCATGNRNIHGRMFSTCLIKRASSAPKELASEETPKLADLGPKPSERLSFSNTELAKKSFPSPATAEEKVISLEHRMSLQPSKQSVNTIKLVGCSVRSSYSENDYIRENISTPIKFKYPKATKENAAGDVPPEPAKEVVEVKADGAPKDWKTGQLLKSRFSTGWAKHNEGRGLCTSASLRKTNGKTNIQTKKAKGTPLYGIFGQMGNSVTQYTKSRYFHSCCRQEVSMPTALRRNAPFREPLRLMSFPCKPGEGKDKGKPCKRRKNPCSETKSKKKKKPPSFRPCDYLDPQKREKMTKRDPDPDLVKPKNKLVPFSSILDAFSSLYLKAGFPQIFLNGPVIQRPLGLPRPHKRKLKITPYCSRKFLEDPEPKDLGLNYAKRLLGTSYLLSIVQRAYFSTKENGRRRDFQFQSSVLPDYLVRPGKRREASEWEDTPKPANTNLAQPRLVFFKWMRPSTPEKPKQEAKPPVNQELSKKYSPCDYLNPKTRKEMESLREKSPQPKTEASSTQKPYKVCFFRKILKKPETPKPPPPPPPPSEPKKENVCVPLEKIAQKDEDFIGKDAKVEAPPPPPKVCKPKSCKSPCDDVFSVKRESCFCPTKEPKPGLLCRIAQIFGIGCGKKGKE